MTEATSGDDRAAAADGVADPEPPESPELPESPEPPEPPEPPAVTPPSRPSPGPRHAAAATTPARRHPRRWFLAGAGAVVVAGAGGVGAALLRGKPVPAANPAPAPLLAAVEAERALIADLDATTGGTPQVRQVLTQARGDHAAHLRALQGLAASYDPAAPSGTPAPGTPRTAALLRAAEARAATIAAGHAAALDGRAATLLASISACEATHAALLP